MQLITSKENEQIKQIHKLKDKKYRDEMGLFVVEGIKTVNEAIAEEADIQTIVICDDSDEQGELKEKMLYAVAKYNIIYVNQRVFEYISEVMHPQGILAVIKKKETQNKINYNEDLLVILVNIQDPGNLGTIIRTVDSIGLTQIILSKGTVDPYSPKVVRSTMSGIFRVNIEQVDDIASTIKQIQKNKFKVVATSLATNKSMYDISYNKTAIVIGNEANGVTKEVLGLADEKVKIPMLGKTESLNAAVAAGVVMYEYVRQKIKKGIEP